MDSKTLETLKKQLLARKEELEERLSWFTKEDKAKCGENYITRFPDYGTKEDENAAEVAAFSDRISMEHTLEVDLKDVKQALERIDKGLYGICKYCKKPIEEKRILIRPTSSSCVDCKRKLKGE